MYMQQQMSAAEQVIKLKQQYQSSDGEGFNKSQAGQGLAGNAAAIRQNAGLDESRYGAHVSLADALTNFAEDFGAGAKQPDPNQYAPPEYQAPPRGDYSQDRPEFDRQGEYDKYEQLMKGSSDAAYRQQQAMLDSTLNKQLADLEMAYKEAINQGEMSVRDAEAQFEAQKAELQKTAYQQAEATKAYGSNMGITHSQQMIGMQQGDNARMNKLQNSNAGDRDRRINDIQDRIKMLSAQKDLQTGAAKAEHGYASAGARSQADYAYMQSMGDFASKDYFTQQQRQHDFDMSDLQYNQNMDMSDRQFAQGNYMADKQYGQNLFMSDKSHGQNMQMSDKQFGQGLSMSDKNFQQNIHMADKQQGFNIDLESLRQNNALVQMAEQHGYNMASMSQSQLYKLEEMNHANIYTVQNMELGSQLNINEIGVQIDGRLKEIDKQAGYTSAENAKDRAATANNIARQLAAVQKQAEDELAARLRNLDPNSQEYKATQGEFKMQLEANQQAALLEGYTQYSLDRNFTNAEDHGLKKPKDYTANGWSIFNAGLNKITGYDKNNKAYNDAESKQKGALDAINRFQLDPSKGGVR